MYFASKRHLSCRGMPRHYTHDMQINRNKIDQKTWDAFVQKHGPRSGLFLQSWMWGEFQKSVGEQVERVAWISNVGEGQAPPVQAVAQVIRKTIPYFGTYAYVPRGPIVVSSFPPPAKEGKEEVSIVNVADHDLFIRIESPIERGQGTPPITGKRISSIQPAHTLITDLTLSTDELLANMHEKTRYNIRLADKKGVKIEMRSATIDEVWPVFEATASRDVFRLHGKEYYRKMMEEGGKEGRREEEGGKETRVFIAIAKHEGNILAANIMIDFGNTRTYLHGASSNVKRNFMAPYLLQWELMKDAKANGITSYDWWGVAPLGAPSSHPWAGISRFKRGFGGEEVSYPDTVDVVLKPGRYMIYNFIRKLRRGFR